MKDFIIYWFPVWGFLLVLWLLTDGLIWLEKWYARYKGVGRVTRTDKTTW